MTTTILVRLLGQDLPAGLEWNDVTLMEKGTGRIPLDERDRLLSA